MTDRIRNGWQWEKIRRRILKRDPLCVDCLPDHCIPSEEVDHRIPLFKGGTDDDSNLAGVCRLCHVVKSIEERGARQQGRPDLTGRPTAASHHWNKT